VPGRVLYVGTLSVVRKLDVILRAFADVRRRYPEATLMMVGEGDFPHERAALESLAAELGLGDSVRFTGFVPIEQAWDLCMSAAVCLSPFYPSRILASTSPTKLVEYMALGRPVVCNDHPEQARAMHESGAGLCVEWGVESFAAAICQLLEDPVAAEALGARGPAWVAANRTYPAIARRVHERYVELLGGAG
jgi:glycosyltransferase involved in cell wall biosynthesis